MAKSENPSLFKRLIKFLFFSALSVAVLSAIAGYFAFKHIEEDLPDIQQLRHVKFQIPLKVFSADNKLISQYGEKKRIPVSYSETPELMVAAFLAAEDDRFFEHPGVDYQGLLRAAALLILTGEKRQGGSTITMQVARNFFLSSEKTYVRKIKEIVLSLKIENELSKEQILELYLNKIYLGHRSYGIGAAAQVYYGKSLQELDLAQIAMIAGLPKAPSSYNPVTNPTRAHTRRDYVLGRMLELKSITPSAYQKAINTPVTAKLHGASIELDAPYIAEMARDFAIREYGEEVAYTEGLNIITTVDSRLQTTATNALRNALHAYDERRGYRGPEAHIDINGGVLPLQNEFLKQHPDIGQTYSALLTKVDDSHATAWIASQEEETTIDIDSVKWARKFLTPYRRGPIPKSFRDFLSPGDIIRLRKITDAEGGTQWQLAQVPDAQGAFIAVDPHTSRVKALVGGYDYNVSKFNRAIQSKRQPGSGFKPILYTTAIENGYTAASIINDAPVVLDSPELGAEWRPENYSGKFFGPTRLRVALRNSRNLVSIRLLRSLGIDTVIESAKRFGLRDDQLPHSLSLALGSGSVSPRDMARIFSTFANGGYLIQPYVIDKASSNNDELNWQHIPTVVCEECIQKMPATPNFLVAPRILAPDVHFIMNSLLQDVVNNGTGVKAKSLGRSDLGGKTGTTNEQKDAWFNGYSPEMVAIAWVGKDSTEPLGAYETGGKAALPMWIEFMETALDGVPEYHFDRPENVDLVRINSETGKLTTADDQNAIFELFREQNVPKEMSSSTPSNPYHPQTTDDDSSNNIESLF